MSKGTRATTRTGAGGKGGSKNAEQLLSERIIKPDGKETHSRRETFFVA